MECTNITFNPRFFLGTIIFFCRKIKSFHKIKLFCHLPKYMIHHTSWIYLYSDINLLNWFLIILCLHSDLFGLLFVNHCLLYNVTNGEIGHQIVGKTHFVILCFWAGEIQIKPNSPKTFYLCMYWLNQIIFIDTCICQVRWFNWPSAKNMTNKQQLPYCE